jgi:hypothetical protein
MYWFNPFIKLIQKFIRIVIMVKRAEAALQKFHSKAIIQIHILNRDT